METMLARMPTTLTNTDKQHKKHQLDKQKTLQKFKQLEYARLKYENRWKSIRDYQLPYLSMFDNEHTSHAERKDQKVLTNTCWESNIVFASGVMSGLTPPSRQWFKLAFSNSSLADNLQISSIVDIRQEILYSVLSKSNFYNAVHQVYMELAFGQGVLGVFPCPDKGVHFIQFPIGSYSMGVSSSGLLNTFTYKYQMNAPQIAEQFGIENVPRKVKDKLTNNNGFNDRFTVCFLVEPNIDYTKDSINKMEMPYRIAYWVDGSEPDEWLHVGGCHEFPILAARYLVNGLEAYGKGAGWFCEGDAKMLQALEKESLISVQMKNRPPMQTDSETATKGVNIFPGALNTITNADRQGIRPLFQNNIDITDLDNKIDKVKDSIRRAYAADLFLLLDQIQKGQMTAREVMERSQEKLQQLAPVVERLQFEFLNRLLERVYNILDRNGIFPEFPAEVLEILQGEELNIEYISPLAQAQKISGLVSIEQSVAFLGNMMQIYPECKYKLNPFETIDAYFERLGSPATIRRSTDDAMKDIQAQQQAAAQQQQAEMLLAAAKPVSDYTQAAKQLNDTVGDGSNKAMGNILADIGGG